MTEKFISRTKHLFRNVDPVFSILLLLLITEFLYSVVQFRIPSWHDGFHYFALQYYYLNNAVFSGEIPQWIPFMTHGVLSTWIYDIQSSFSQNFLLLIAPVLKWINFVILFNVGIFFDEFILLLGTWLLAKRFFSSSLTVAFVTISVLGSCIWMLQPGFNFYNYFAIPLILHFFHSFFETRKWRYFLLGGNLLALQTFGNNAYALPVTSFTIFIYLTAYLLFNRKTAKKHFVAIKNRPFFIVTILLILLCFLGIYMAIVVGSEQLVNYTPGRNPDGTTTLKAFMSYGGTNHFIEWSDVFWGVAPYTDISVYIGLVAICFVLIGLFFNLNKRRLHFLVVTIILILFSQGTFVAKIAYYTWPFMKFYRHLYLVENIARLFICFLAGFGFEVIINKELYARKEKRIRISCFFLGVFMAILSGMLFVIVKKQGPLPPYGAQAGLLNSAYLLFFYGRWPLLNKNVFIALLTAGLFFGLASKKGQTYLVAFALIALFVQMGDMCWYKYRLICQRTSSLEKNARELTEFTKIPYRTRRSRTPWYKSSRAQMLFSSLPGNLLIESAHNQKNPFLFYDAVEAVGRRTDFWMRPLDDFIKAYAGRPLKEPLPEKFRPGKEGWQFPAQSSALKTGGVTQDKIQFFGFSFLEPDLDNIASYMRNPKYKGDFLFLFDPQAPGYSKYFVERVLPDAFLSQNARIDMPYSVERFDSNNLVVSADNRTGKNIWMLYSDVWHPFWKATVNGQFVKVYRANLAYKAVQLAPGPNRIHFRFNSPLLTFLYYCFGINSLFWLIYVVSLMKRNIIKGGDERNISKTE